MSPSSHGQPMLHSLRHPGMPRQGLLPSTAWKSPRGLLCQPPAAACWHGRMGGRRSGRWAWRSSRSIGGETSDLGNDDCSMGIPEVVPEPPELPRVAEPTRLSPTNRKDKSNTAGSPGAKQKKPCPESQDAQKGNKADKQQKPSLQGVGPHPVIEQFCEGAQKGISDKETRKVGEPAAAAVSKAKAKAKTEASKATPGEEARSSTIPEELQSLAGLWLDKADMKPLAILQESEIFWFGYEGVPPCAVKAQPGKKIAMALNGKENVANLFSGSPPQLEWDDGSTWIREELQGTWKNNDEDRMIGQIVDGRIHWDPIFETPEPTALSPIPPLPQATVKMKLCGEICIGTFHPGLPATLKWSDGETWTRVGMTR
eukprot:TRINITY_DN8556_c0_g1_i2.p1 TRINITY_DN8556_c0_g1~~TRINITY_DN8556_c0_g1_i2.p1  ORF type:complete len:371 (-),score=62.75 TRINITY_DN8556_c0_g1_i2:46-1158(-)